MSRSPSTPSNPTRLSMRSDRIGSPSPLDPVNTSINSTPLVQTPPISLHETAPLAAPIARLHADRTPLQRPIGEAQGAEVPELDLGIELRPMVVTPEPTRSFCATSPMVEKAKAKLALNALDHSSGEMTPGRLALRGHAIKHVTDNSYDIEVALRTLQVSRSVATSEADRETFNAIATPSVMTHIGDIQSLILKTYHQTKTSPEDSGWEFYFDSKSIIHTMGYYGQVWINNTKKQVVLVSSGTKVYFPEFEGSSYSNLFGVMHLIKDLINDIQLFSNSAPSQYKGVRKFIDLMVSKFREDSIDLADYDIIFTGHSLGAITSDMGMLYAKTIHDLNVHSITMENPGSAPSMKILAEKMQKHLKSPDLDDAKKHCTVVNNAPNWINTACQQFGDVYLNLVTRYQEQELPAFWKFAPSSIRGLLLETLKQFEFHDKGYFAQMPDMRLQQTWPVGIFRDILVEKIADTVASCESIILGSPLLSSLFVDVVKLVKTVGEKSSEAKQKVIEFCAEVKEEAELFFDHILSYDEIGGIGDTEEDSVVA